MLLLYNAGIRLYFLAIYPVSLFNKKAKQWISGRKQQHFIKSGPSAWFHFASLGEFEQGRPVLEQMRMLRPELKIVVTFFSPSGYEIRKNTPLADHVYYLPLDTAKNARRFIDTIQPVVAIFTKYEYWYHFYKELNNKEIPLYIISGIFRPGQVFFKWHGGLHRRMLSFVTHFFVQDDRSKQLLQSIGITNSSISGDTRFDRVWANAQQPKALPLIAQFKGDRPLFVAGSTWPPDEQLLSDLIKANPNWKFIIAPHEIGEDKISKLADILASFSTVKYSEIINNTKLIANKPELNTNYQCLIIDNIGMLSSLYQYGNIAYIGGGFGAGIHNTLEAAAFGLPVIFGPNYDKFKEAKDLINLGAGFTISNAGDLETIAGKLMNNEPFRSSAGQTAGKYVAEHTGATSTIVNAINKV
ncbi:MAG: 3-deoxy-D-manno-octulosonic acid transferase [Mucilaginibacter sp.]